MKTKNIKQNFTYNFAILYFFHYLTSSLIMSQRMTFLIRTSYSLQQRSLIYAAIPLVSIGLPFFMGYLSDKYQTTKKLIIVSIVLSSITAYLFYSIQIQFFVFHFAMTILSESLIRSMEDLSDVWVLESKGPSKNNFGFIRSFGSAGWALGSFLLAQIVLYAGYQGLALTSLLFNVLILAIVLTIRDDKSEVSTDETKISISLSDVKEIFKNNTYLIVILIMFFIRFADAITGYILIDKMLALGGNEWHIGMRYVIAAGVEIPVFMLGDTIHKHIGSMKMITIATITYTLMFFGYYLANSNNIIFIVTILQSISFPFFMVATKYLILELSPTHLKATGQIVGPSIVNGVQGVLHPLISAFLVGLFTINSPLLLAAIFGLIALILTIPLGRKYKAFTKENRTYNIE